MRFLPYVLVAFMLAPVAIWALIDTMVVSGSSGNMFGFENAGVVAVLMAFGAVAVGLLGWWMQRFIARDQSRA